MQGKMKVAVMTGVGRSAFEEREIPRPKAGEVLVKLEYIGICGSDLHYYATGGIGDCRVEPPFVLGHEAGGTVVEAGAGRNRPQGRGPGGARAGKDLRPLRVLPHRALQPLSRRGVFRDPAGGRRVPGVRRARGGALLQAPGQREHDGGRADRAARRGLPCRQPRGGAHRADGGRHRLPDASGWSPCWR